MRRSRLLTALVLCPALLLPLPASARQTPPPSIDSLPPNPFAGFESFRLPNGLKVWYGYLPGATLTSMAISVPAGRDQDPRGREQTAHFLEHVLLSDRHGRTEADLARELTSRGGSHNGVTGARSTYFPLSIGTAEAAYGLHWLHGVIAPRSFSDDLVERNREPVAIELGTRSSGLLSGLAFRFLDHPRLRPASFWRREFGLEAPDVSGARQRTSLAAVTAADLRTFYDTYYAPTDMTLIVVTGAPRAALQPVLDATFATLPWRPPPAVEERSRVRSSEARRFQWRPGSSTRIVVRYRIPELNGLDQLRLVFIEDLLRYRLMERLRRGDAKTVYSITTTTAIRGPAAYFGIHADMNPRQERLVRRVLDDELGRLVAAAADTSAFYTERDALSRRVRVENASPAALRSWATDRFQRPDLHEAFPDVGAYYATVGPDSIGALAARLFVTGNRILHVWRPLPLPVPVLAALALLVILLAARLYRAAALRPADMTRVRYLARLRPPVTTRIMTTAALALAALIVLRLALAAAHITAEYWLLAVDSFTLTALAAASLLFLGTFAVLAGIGRMHHKVLVFEHELRIKSPTYRSIVLPASRITAVSTVSARDRLRSHHFLTPPPGNAVLLELDDGTRFVLHVREPALLMHAVRRLIPAAPAAPPRPAMQAHPAEHEPCLPQDTGGEHACQDALPAAPPRELWPRP
jgi:predicted Zn-dependent peptidase